MKFTQKFFQPGYWNANGAPRRFTRKELSEYCRNTQAFIEANQEGGIPIFPVHASPGTPEGGPQLSRRDARDNVGWVEGVRIDAAGDCYADYDVLDERTAECIGSGKIKFTSPEFGAVDHVDSKGKSWGKMFRHMATTATPGNREQGPILSLQCSEDFYQFSEDDFMGKTKKEAEAKVEENVQFNEDEAKKRLAELSEAPTNDDTGDAETSSTETTDTDELPTNEPEVDVEPEPAVEPEVDAVPDNAQTINDLVMQIKEISGIILPPEADAVATLTAIVNMLAEKQRAEVASNGGLPQVTEESPVAQFSEEQQAMWDAQQGELATLRAERNAGRMAVKRAEIESDINQARAPKRLKTRLAGILGAVQFSEDGDCPELPTFTIRQVLALVHDAYPKSMQFDEADVTEAAHPEGDKFFNKDDSTEETDEEADKAVDEQLNRAGMGEGGFSGNSSSYRRSYSEQPAAV